MLHLIPRVKELTESKELFSKGALCYDPSQVDARVARALKELPTDSQGIPLTVTVTGTEGEGYTLSVKNDGIAITADSSAGAFYAVQTLRQIYDQEGVFCLEIKDKPDFKYRGFYHDITRGKIPKIETLKQLIDRMAYYKLNSLQLYVEHVFEFRETKDLQPLTGFITGAELEELDAYCKERFIDFIPSLSTFGHMYEILQQPRYQHLRVLDDYQYDPNFWHARMAHHTVDPLQEESFALVKSLIDQFMPHFSSDTFNICCDETFDLTQHKRTDLDRGQMYVEFVKKIIAYLESKGKKVMMWADILLKHPETIDALPADTCFLNWTYRQNPPEEQVEKLVPFGRPQIVCPGTSTWSRLCENVPVAEGNIGQLAEYGYKHGAVGVLNTNWGDWANPCSIELAMYGMVLGAEKSWSVNTPVDDTFHAAADALLYHKQGRFEQLCALSEIQSMLPWNAFCGAYVKRKHTGEYTLTAEAQTLALAAEQAQDLLRKWAEEEGDDPYREEMMLAARGLWCMAELSAKLAQIPMEQTSDVEGWVADYGRQWRKKNKESEIRHIETMFRYLATI
ncbi:MAG: family 20 glycosylhydrolase [Clostridia bacterium]|nr:family 20 glycosylhydrolase [Clostridia bacterium]